MKDKRPLPVQLNEWAEYLGPDNDSSLTLRAAAEHITALEAVIRRDHAERMADTGGLMHDRCLCVYCSTSDAAGTAGEAKS